MNCDQFSVLLETAAACNGCCCLHRMPFPSPTHVPHPRPLPCARLRRAAQLAAPPDPKLLITDGREKTDGFGTTGQDPSTLVGWQYRPKNALYYGPGDVVPYSGGFCGGRGGSGLLEGWQRHGEACFAGVTACGSTSWVSQGRRTRAACIG